MPLNFAIIRDSSIKTTKQKNIIIPLHDDLREYVDNYTLVLRYNSVVVSVAENSMMQFESFIYALGYKTIISVPGELTEQLVNRVVCIRHLTFLNQVREYCTNCLIFIIRDYDKEGPVGMIKFPDLYPTDEQIRYLVNLYYDDITDYSKFYISNLEYLNSSLVYYKIRKLDISRGIKPHDFAQ